jgi:endonuclease YncB( thermonuclease family)
MLSRCFALFLLLLATAPAAAETARVREVIDGDTVVLANGEEVRLVGIQAPKLPLGRPGFPTWPLAPEAKRVLETLVLSKEVRLERGEQGSDRHGRILAQLYDRQDRWVQGEMLRRGMARVYTFADNRRKAAEMLALEREARAARRGIWALDYYRVQDAAGTPKPINTFQLVEGEVRRVAQSDGRVFLNFGDDWHKDFTVKVATRDAALMRRSGLDLALLEGRRIRVRGWLRAENGPMIEATHAEQIESLEAE